MVAEEFVLQQETEMNHNGYKVIGSNLSVMAWFEYEAEANAYIERYDLQGIARVVACY